jgi:endonuclease/exonuclease/phosphatase (EEP) superfamily protein YafD
VRDVRALLLSAVPVLALLLSGPLAGAPASAMSPASAGQPRHTPTTGTIFWANAWAAHHTSARGAMSGTDRMRRLVRVVRSSDVHLGALAEVERSQIASFRRAAPAYELFVGGRGTTDAVFWDRGSYEVVHAYRFRGLTYGGRRIPVPVAVLRDRSTDALLAVMAVHNPRDGWRGRALGRELKEVRRIRGAYDGPVAVFVAGDFNAGSSVVCRARHARLYSVGHRHHCGSAAPIDQLLTDRDVHTRGYRPMSPRRITDHPAVYRARFSIGSRS